MPSNKLTRAASSVSSKVGTMIKSNKGIHTCIENADLKHIDKYKDEINAPNEDGNLPVIMAINMGDIDVIDRVLSFKPDLSLIEQESNCRLDQWIVEHGSSEVVVKLDEHFPGILKKKTLNSASSTTDDAEKPLDSYLPPKLRNDPDLKKLVFNFPAQQMKMTPEPRRKAASQKKQVGNVTLEPFKIALEPNMRHANVERGLLEKIASISDQLNQLLIKKSTNSPKIKRTSHKKSLKREERKADKKAAKQSEIKDQKKRIRHKHKSARRNKALVSAINTFLIHHSSDDDWVAFTHRTIGISEAFSPLAMIQTLMQQYDDYEPLQQVNALFIIKDLLFYNQLNTHFWQDSEAHGSVQALFEPFLNRIKVNKEIKNLFVSLIESCQKLNQKNNPSGVRSVIFDFETMINQVAKGELKDSERRAFMEAIGVDLTHTFARIFTGLYLGSDVNPFDTIIEEKPQDLASAYNLYLSTLSEVVAYDVISRPVEEAYQVYKFYLELAEYQLHGNPYYKTEQNSFLAIVWGLTCGAVSNYKNLQNALLDKNRLAKRAIALNDREIDPVHNFEPLKHNMDQETSRPVVPYIGAILKELALCKDADFLQADGEITPQAYEVPGKLTRTAFNRLRSCRLLKQLDHPRTNVYQRFVELQTAHNLSPEQLRQIVLTRWEFEPTEHTTLDEITFYLDCHEQIERESFNSIHNWRLQRIAELQHKILQAKKKEEQLPPLIRDASFLNEDSLPDQLALRLERLSLTPMLNRKVNASPALADTFSKSTEESSQDESQEAQSVLKLSQSLDELNLNGQSPKQKRTQSDPECSKAVYEAMQALQELKALKVALDEKPIKRHREKMKT